MSKIIYLHKPRMKKVKIRFVFVHFLYYIIVMLQSLRIQNIALIPEVEIEFGQGLNVLTGETGAGKSIIIGSFNFVLGERLNKNVIRQGAAFARVDAVFNAPGAERSKITEISGVDFNDSTVILSRTLKTDGKSDCRINGVTVTAEILRNSAAVLINIHGQHETEVLLKPKNHVNILDSFGGQKVHTVKRTYLDEHQQLQSLKKQLKAFGGDDAERKRLIDMYQYQICEIESAGLKDDEDISLTEKKSRMQNFEKIAIGLGSAVSAFDGDGGVESVIGSVISALTGISHIDSRIEKFLEHVKSVKIDLDDLGSDMQNYLDNMEFDEDEFKRVDARLDEIKILKRKYGNSIADIFSFLNETRRNLDFLTRGEEDMEKIKRDIEAQQQVVKDAADRLTEIRRQTAESLEGKLAPHLKDLGMPSARFQCTDITVDSVEFLFSANAGENLRPLVHIISGGEMSRFMLALKAVTANLEGVGTLVFDEIDTGISGTMGHKIAEKMAAICKFHQVIAVTHLAQIASRAQRHVLIKKEEINGKTITNVIKLDEAQARQELTRMVGGADFISSFKG